jgi:hypothetical protein
MVGPHSGKTALSFPVRLEPCAVGYGTGPLYPKYLGMAMTRLSQYVQIMSTPIEAIRKGTMARETLSRLTFAMEQAMNGHTPTGGVVSPITKPKFPLGGCPKSALLFPVEDPGYRGGRG